MSELGSAVVPVIAFSKAILVLYCVGVLYLIWRGIKPAWYALLTGASVFSLYLVLAWPLKTMWWGNTGDENFVLAFLTQTLHGNLFRDFYHAWLPPYYPPLYFWLTGTIGRFFTANSVQAAKIGVSIVLALWFVVPAVMKRMYGKRSDGPVSDPWFWFLAPFAFLLMTDFDTIMTKPYEVFPALLVVLLAGVFGRRLGDEQWSKRDYMMFGIAGGVLFMAFYFWFFIVCAGLLLTALVSKQRKRSFSRMFFVGSIMFAVVSPYLAPLLLSYLRYGIENWQGQYLVPDDFTFVVPFGFSVRGLIALGGFATMVFESRRSAFIGNVFVVFILCYVYQQIGALQFLWGAAPLMPLKPFPFLTNACLSVAAAYGAYVLYQRYSGNVSTGRKKVIMAMVFLFAVSQLPFVRFIGSAETRTQLQSDLQRTVDTSLAQAITSSVPDYAERTWLVSDVPAVSGTLPLSYFISFNQHYSHHAGQFTKRFDLIKRLGTTQSSDEFNAAVDEGSPRKIDAMALYTSPGKSDYLLFFWVDNYPNGGKEEIVSIPHRLLEGGVWKTRYASGEWTIVTR